MNVLISLMSMFFGSWKEEKEGFGTIELVLLVCVLIALALIFKGTIIDFVKGILSTISSQGSAFNPASLAG